MRTRSVYTSSEKVERSDGSFRPARSSILSEG